MKKIICLITTLLIILSGLSSCDGDSSSNGKIIMEYNDSYFEDGDWNLESTIDYFKELGFVNIETISESDYFLNEIVFDVEIDTGMFDEDGFNSGDSFDVDDVIEIYYYSNSFVLTTENCTDLATALATKDIDYMEFANEYDGKIVKFDAYVAYHDTYWGETGQVIDVCGGDYDGTSELGHADNDYYKGLVVRIGDKSWDSEIDESVEEGQNVTVVGKIDFEQSEYYKCLYIECYYLGKR